MKATIIIMITLITFFLLLPPLDFECLFGRNYPHHREYSVNLEGMNQ